MKAVLVDDDIQYCEIFLECLKTICLELEIDIACDSCQDAGEILKKGISYDVYFLDIEMEGINGIELAEEIRRRNTACEIFFISFHENYVYDIFGVRAGGFIRKKELRSDLYKSLRFVIKCELKEQSAATIQLKNGGHLMVKPMELLYCQSEEHYVRFYWQDERNEIHRIKLKAVEAVLREYGFLRVHERYLVNREYIQTLRPNKLSMMSGQEIPISRSYKKKIQMILFDLREP